MKPIFKIIIVVSTFGYLAGCNLEKTNVNPNASTEVALNSVLTGAEVSLAFNLGVNGGLISNIYIQQVSGANGDAASFDNYSTGPSYFNSTWTGFYSGVLNNLKIIRRTATERQLPYYSGVARILSAYAFSTLTDVFGDIPYTEALYGNGIVNPVFDKQETIYPALQLQLDSAISELAKPVSENIGAVLGGDDVIFNGNIQRWTEFAYTLKARLAIHLSKKDAKAAAQQVLSLLYNNGIYRGLQNDAQVLFGTSATNANPYYQQNVTRPGWIGLGGAFVNLLNGNKVTDDPATPQADIVDPRRAYFATPYPVGSTTYRGSIAGVPGAYSTIGNFYATASSPVVLLSYSEAKFLEAEARIILDASDPLAQTALEAAITSSFAKVITNANDAYATPEKQAAYIAAKAKLTANFQKDIETIITQKYIALFLQPEVWSDYRRTGFPAIPLAQNATNAANPNGLIPRRIPYPQSEQSLNKNTPSNSGYQQPKLWWDGQ